MSTSTTVYVDLSDMFRHGVRTGIQRVVSQVLPRLAAGADDEFQVRMLRFDPVEHHYDEFDTASALASLVDGTSDPVVVGHRAVDDFQPSDVFLDLDSAWNSPLKRSALYPRLKAAGVTIVSYLYDLVPLKAADVVHETTSANWIVWVSAVLAYSDLVMTDSRSAERDFLELAEELDVGRHIPTVVTRLGCDLPEVPEPTHEELARLEPFAGGRFLLFVGTIEPRKRHALALRAFTELADQYPDAHLVFAGRKGWLSDQTLEMMAGHPLYGERLHWVDSPSDALLETLYERATACIYLSRYEGYGLPIAEALAHGRVTLASQNSSMYEVGGDACDYTRYNTVAEVVETLGQYLGDPELLAARERFIKETFRPLDWDTVSSTIEAVLRGLPRARQLRDRPRPRQLQMVYISNNPAKLERAIPLWDARSSFVSEYVVVAPATMLDRIRSIRSRVPIVAIDEGRILAGREAEFRAADHQHKNWMLRSGLVELDEVDDLFVMLDDDNLPLTQVDVDAFITGSGVMRAHYFHDLNRWVHRTSEFDEGQRAIAAALGPAGFELLSYASHQPQLIDKQLFREAVQWADRHAGRSNICEWATYFNHSVTRYPTLFQKRVFRTLNWPGRASDWPQAYSPRDLIFENYYSKSYSIGLFKGLAPSDPAALKIARKRAELVPFERTRDLMDQSHRRLQRHELVHGPIRFAADDFQLLVAGIPQVVMMAARSQVWLDVSYQLLGHREPHDVSLSYSVDGGPARGRRIRRLTDTPQDYETGAASLAISATRPGIYDLEFFLQVDGELIGVEGIRYLAKLVVVGRGQSVESYIDQLATSAPAEPTRGASRKRVARKALASVLDRVDPSRAERRRSLRLLRAEVARLRAVTSRTPRALAEVMEFQRATATDVEGLRRQLSRQRPSSPLERVADLISRADRSLPVYGLRGFGGDPETHLVARARRIEDALGRLVGKRILVVGSAFGYLPMYFAERGAKATGWETDVASAAVARAVADVTGSAVVLGAVPDLTTRLAALETAVYDVAIVDPSVSPESSEMAEWLKILVERVPIVIHDAWPGERVVSGERRVLGQFRWVDESQPRDLVALMQDQVVSVNGRDYPYDRVTAESYLGSPMTRQDRFRRYYMHPQWIVKEYHFESTAQEELRQPLREIDISVNFLREAKVWHSAVLTDFEFSRTWVRIVYPAIAGSLVSDLAPLGIEDVTRTAHDLLRTLDDLARLGVHHNDIRSWNVIFGAEGAWLIDYGLARHQPTESNPVALMWTLHVALTGEPESHQTGKSSMPPAAPFAGTPLQQLYDTVAAGETDWAVLLGTVDGPEAQG